MQTILSQPITTLIPLCTWGQPKPAYGEGDGDPITAVLPPPTTEVSQADVLPPVGEVKNSQAPDFSALDDKYEQDGTKKTPKAPDPAKPDATKAKEAPAKAPETAQKPPETAKPLVDAAAPVKPPEKAEKEPFDPDAALKEVDKAAIRPHASPETKEGFKRVKEIAGQAIGENKTLKTRLAEAESKLGKLPTEVETELKELREFREIWGTENDPAFEKQWQDKVAARETALYDMLAKEPAIAMPEKAPDGNSYGIEDIKKAGLDTKEGRTMVNGILNAIDKTGDKLLYHKLLTAVNARYGVADEKAAALGELRGKQGTYQEQRAAKEKAENETWNGGVNKTLESRFKEPGAEWGFYKKPDEAATPEEKAQAEAFNARLKDEVVPAIHKALNDARAKNPEHIANLVFDHFALKETQAQLKAAQAELEEVKARNAELTQTAAGVRQVSDPSKLEGAPATPATTNAVSSLDDAETAVDKFFAGKK